MRMGRRLALALPWAPRMAAAAGPARLILTARIRVE